MRWIDKILPKGSFLRNVVTLLSGTAISQIITILVSPVITRLYGPELFGMNSYYVSILSILSAVVCLRYELAIVLPEDDKEAASLFNGIVFVIFIFSIFVFICIYFSRFYIARVLKTPDFAFWLLMLPISVFVAGFYQLFNYWVTRKKQFSRLASRQIASSLVTAGVQVSGGYINKGSACGLILGNILGQVAAVIKMGLQIWKEDKKTIKFGINIRNIVFQLKKYKRYPLFSTWGSLLNILSNMLPALLFGYFFTPSMSGYYSLAHRLLTLPMSFVGSAISQVFFPKAAEANKEGKLADITVTTFITLFKIGFVPLCLVAICAPELFSIVFGEEWIVSGEYVRYFVVWIFLQLLASPLSTVYDVMQKQTLFMIQNIFFFVLRLIVIIYAGIKGDSTLCVFLYGLLGAVLYLYYLIAIFIISGISFQRGLFLFANLLLQSFPFLIIPLLSVFLLKSEIIICFVSIMTGVIYILFLLKTTDIGKSLRRKE